MIIRTYIDFPEGRKTLPNKTLNQSIETVQNYRKKGFYAYTMITPSKDDK